MKKAIIAIMLIVSMLLTLPFSVTAETLLEKRMPDAWLTVNDYWQGYVDSGICSQKPAYVIGDANMNGTVEAADALFALYYCVGANPYTCTLPRQAAPHYPTVEKTSFPISRVISPRMRWDIWPIIIIAHS